MASLLVFEPGNPTALNVAVGFFPAVGVSKKMEIPPCQRALCASF